jgi:hypothetical protein
MKVHVWSKFWKKKIWKKVKSPLSMNFWRISTSKRRGTLQKMGYCAPTPPPPLQEVQAQPEKNLKKYVSFFSKKKIKKKGSDLGRVPYGTWTRAGQGTCTGQGTCMGQGTCATHWPRPGQGPVGLVALPLGAGPSTPATWASPFF